VQVGTASFTRPDAAARIVGELEAFCQAEGVADVNELIGALSKEGPP